MVADDRPWRCFVAVPIGAALRAALEGYVEPLRSQSTAGDWRWTEPDAWHVTLAFMGATDSAQVPVLAEALADVAREQVAFALTTGGVGTFSSRGRARVLWYGVADPEGRLRRLAAGVRNAVGLSDEAPFRGHLTLARARDRHGADASNLVSLPAPPGELEVDRLVLFRSHLGHGPTRYEALSNALMREAPQ